MNYLSKKVINYKYFIYKRFFDVLLRVVPDSQPKTQSELYKSIDADYYGYRDEKDGKLLDYESILETDRMSKERVFFNIWSKFIYIIRSVEIGSC